MNPRNARTFERLKKVILKGNYDKEEMILDITDFLDMGTLTDQEFQDLLELIEQNPPVNLALCRLAIDENGYVVSDNTFNLLYKQIIKRTYQAEIIEQLITDFKITGAITREQFRTLYNLIEDIYYPVIDENFDEEFIDY